VGGRKYTKEEDPGMIDGYYKVIQTWRIHVWNSALPKDQQKQLRLFPEWQETATLLMKAYEKRMSYHRNKTSRWKRAYRPGRSRNRRLSIGPCVLAVR
jgi:hypothetical protein